MKPDIEPILNKARRYCAFQERCGKEVEDRLKAWKASPAQAKEVVRRLKEEKYLDDGRFARMFASGRFRTRHWGKVRIRYELKAKGIAEAAISVALDEIDENSYVAALKSLLERKGKEIKDTNPLARKKKLFSFAMQKGYETEVIYKALGSKEDE